jgi:nickel-dependent lactate racemase
LYGVNRIFYIGYYLILIATANFINILIKKFAECDIAIIIGTIEPHLWAGFGGGLKNIFLAVDSKNMLK